MTLEAMVEELMNNGIDVQLIVPAPKDECGCVGVRLHPYGRDLPKNRMILAAGLTFEDALAEAVGKATDGRWENLNWAGRPWEVHAGRSREIAEAYGLV